jgi:hypothetical protein
MDTLTQLDTPRIAGLLVVGALGVLWALRKSFGGVSVKLGD